jgi:hypothetical protein
VEDTEEGRLCHFHLSWTMYVLFQARSPVRNDYTVEQSRNSAQVVRALTALARRKVEAGRQSRSCSCMQVHAWMIIWFIWFRLSFGRRC